MAQGKSLAWEQEQKPTQDLPLRHSRGLHCVQQAASPTACSCRWQGMQKCWHLHAWRNFVDGLDREAGMCPYGSHEHKACPKGNTHVQSRPSLNSWPTHSTSSTTQGRRARIVAMMISQHHHNHHQNHHQNHQQQRRQNCAPRQNHARRNTSHRLHQGAGCCCCFRCCYRARVGLQNPHCKSPVGAL